MIQSGPHTPARIPPRGLPPFAYFLSVLGGPAAFLPYLGRSPSRLFRVLLILAALAPIPAVAAMPFNWLFMGVFLGAWNLLWSLACMAVIPLERGAPGGIPLGRRLRTAFGLTLAALPVAVMLVGLEQWLSDRLWSSYYPVNASADSISTELGAVWLNFGLLLFFSALHASRTGESWNLKRLLGLIGLVAGAHLALDQVYMLLVTIPLWQVEELSIFPSWLDRSRQILFFILWFTSVPVLVQRSLRRGREGRPFLGDFAAGLAALCLSMAGLAAVTGLPINYALLAGQHYEKSGTPVDAIPWYSRALSWSRSDDLKSYLQFRVALLHRKTGNLDEARQAFLRVLVKYYHDSRLLLEAHEFRARLENPDSASKRVVIPGIEARTEYKAAYCVPNSLGLVLNYWGDRTGAKRIGAEITQLDRGSFITDEAFYAESRGFANFVLPLRTLDDIFKLVDHDIPVLAFIPGHVIAIFGYDQALRTLVTYDVNTYDIWDDQRWSEFGQDWSHMYNTLGVVVPREKVPLVKGILGPDIVAQNEAYLQFLLSRIDEGDVDRRALHLGRAAGHGFFFADWEYEDLIGKRPLPAVPDSSIARFLLGHDVFESQILEYLRSLYQRGDYDRAIAFVERYRKENRLSAGMATLLAGCYYQTGQDAKASDVLLGYIDLDDQDPVTLEFLLKQDYVQDDPETARRIALKLLEADGGVPGSAAGLAYRTWRRNTVIDFRNIDEALAIIEGYISKWNPYDREAIAELLQAAKSKKFRSDDELNRSIWEKKARIYKARLGAGP